MNKELLNSDNSCEPKRLPFQNGMSNLKFFNPSTCQPFNFTAPPLSRLRHSRHKAYRAQASQGSAVPFVYRGGRELVEHFTPHSSPFTYQRAAIRIIRDVGKAWFSDTLRAGFAIAHSAPLRKSAFTLAEVLITLGIIGVVAAMTLPALINKTQHQELQTGLKKNYTVLQQALLRAQLDTGEVVKPANYQKVKGVTKGSPLKKLLIKYIKNAQDCGEGTEKGSCIENGSITGNENAKNPYITFNAKNSVIPNWLDDGQFITTDGTLFLLESAMGDGSTVYPILITVDVNGVQKRPNRWGYDLFTFQLTDSGKLLPVGAEGTSYTDMSKYCSLTNTSNQNGVGCTYKALTDKDYWKNLQ